MSLIMLNSVFKVNKMYNPQALLVESKYEIKNNNKMENLINDDLELNSSDESDNGYDNDEFID